RLEDSRVRLRARGGPCDDFLRPPEGAGHDGIRNPEVDEAQVPQLDGDIAQSFARPIGSRDQPLERDIEGPGDADELIQRRPPPPQFEVRDLGLGRAAARGELGLAQSPLEAGRGQVRAEMLELGRSITHGSHVAPPSPRDWSAAERSADERPRLLLYNILL